MRFSGFKNEFSEFFNFQRRLERKLKITALDNDVREIKKMDL